MMAAPEDDRLDRAFADALAATEGRPAERLRVLAALEAGFAEDLKGALSEGDAPRAAALGEGLGEVRCLARLSRLELAASLERACVPEDDDEHGVIIVRDLPPGVA